MFFKKICLNCLNFYKSKISPFFPLRCRYYPTCSEYMLESIKIFGVFKGIYRGILRFLRCNMFFKGGFDPVLKESLKNIKRF